VWYLILAHLVDVPEPKTEGCIIGVDFGVKRLMVATNSANSRTFFFKGGELNHRRTCIRNTRAQIQSVGSRSSRRLLQRMRHNEAAVTGHLLHVASKALVKYAVDNGARRIVLEDLTNIRDSSLRTRKDHRAKINRWPFAQGQFKITYKAQNVGIAVEKVDPRNTSRGCSACGYVSPSNRHGLRFHCKKCGHQEDADRNASVNIRLRSIVAAQAADAMGSFQPPESAEPLDILTDSPVLHDELVRV
jgi:IS605 OrfB family transposase